MIFKAVPAGRVVSFSVMIVAVLAISGCSPREQARGKRWKAQADAYLQGKEAPSESAWPLQVSEEEEDDVVRQKVTFPDLVEALPPPQSWPQLQSGMVLRFLSAQSKGEWRVEIQNRILHLFFIYLNDLDRYSARRWDKAAERLNKRLDAIANSLSPDSPDQQMIAQVKMQIAAADRAVKIRFGKPDGGDEIKNFEAQLKSLEPLDRAEVAKRAGGEAELAGMENFMSEATASYMKLSKKIEEYKGQDPGKEFKAEAEAMQEQFRVQAEKYQKALQDPMVAKYLEEKMDPQLSGRYQVVTVPDLVTIVGSSKSEQYLKRALLLPAELYVPVGESTRVLAGVLALKYAHQLKAPQWKLVNSLQSGLLFEALQKRFPARADEADSSDRSEAEVYYLFGLVAQNRADDALAWMGKIYPSMNLSGEGRDRWSIPSTILEQMQAAGYSEEVWGFLAKLLDRYPNVPLWDEFITLSSKLDKNPAMLDLVERTVKREGLKAEIRGTMQQTSWEMKNKLADAYLGADKVEEGVAVLHSLLSQPGRDDADTWRRRYDTGIQLANLGQLLQRSDWLEEGLAVAEGQLVAVKTSDLEYYKVRELIEVYEKLGRNEDAERILKGSLQRLASAREELSARKTPEEGRDYPTEDILARHEDAQFLQALLALYVNENRDEEALNLLTQSPDWGKADLADFLNDSTGYPSYPTGYWAAWALGRLGKKDEALVVARGQIRVKPGSDGAYAILTQLQGKEALPFLEKIYLMDQFEERPLIWKAKILTDAGDLEEAEKVAKEAVAVDPSDGEQGKGDRMRVYAVMAEIEKKKGDDKKAEFFNNIVRAIRLSEDADDYTRAGLNTRAIAMYRQALGFFSDAYCIQSRLARQLVDQHQEEEAMEHYQRAYELMPESFGRVESHCFGCEKAFAGEKAQGVAERTFLAMLKKQPGKPQLHYLMGYLREEQDRYQEALAYYQQAVALDPLYLNAWKHIADLDRRIRIDPRILDQVQLRLLALDPSRRHSSPDLDSINDLPKLWGHLQLSDRILNMVPKPDAVYELTASEEALEQQKREREKRMSKNARSMQNDSHRSDRDETNFARIILQHPAVEALQSALEAARNQGSQSSSDMDSEVEY